MIVDYLTFIPGVERLAWEPPYGNTDAFEYGRIAGTITGVAASIGIGFVAGGGVGAAAGVARAAQLYTAFTTVAAGINAVNNWKEGNAGVGDWIQFGAAAGFGAGHAFKAFKAYRSFRAASNVAGDIHQGSGLPRHLHNLAVDVVSGRKSRMEALRDMTPDQINQMAAFFRRQAMEARRSIFGAFEFNMARARYLEQGGPRPPGNLHQFRALLEEWLG